MFFKNIFGPFPRAIGVYAHYFRIPLRLLHTLQFSPRFYLISFIILLSHSRRFEIFSTHPGARAHHFRIPLLMLHNLPLNIFFKRIFQKFLGAFSQGPRGSCPPFSNSASSATYPLILSRRCYLISFIILLTHSRRFEIFSTHPRGSRP